jgi:hypothetical protein
VLRKKQKREIIITIVVTVIIGIVIVNFYSADQTKILGYNFGNELKNIQDELKVLQTDFNSKYILLNEEIISKEEFLEYSEIHFKKMENLILKYEELSPPKSFVASVELFKLSTMSQLDSDKQITEWIKTGEDSAKTRSDLLIQESFEYELAALEKFNEAKAGINP